jgi:hypothetical protein
LFRVGLNNSPYEVPPIKPSVLLGEVQSVPIFCPHFHEPASGELTQLVHKIAHRVRRYLERHGWLERDAENSYLALDTADDDPLSVLHGHSIAYRIALGPQAWRKVFTLQTLPPVDSDEMHSGTVGQVAGFNLHAGVAARADQRCKLERLCRYITRPAVSEQRLSLTTQGKVRYQLKTPYRDGTTQIDVEIIMQRVRAGRR